MTAYEELQRDLKEQDEMIKRKDKEYKAWLSDMLANNWRNNRLKDSLTEAIRSLE